MDERLKRLLEFYLNPGCEDEKSVDEYLDEEQVDAGKFAEKVQGLLNEKGNREKTEVKVKS
jgi:hypothetical protein